MGRCWSFRKRQGRGKKVGELLNKLNIRIDISYTSYLKRAIETLTIILKSLSLPMKFNTAWELNERHYGSLTGLNKEKQKKIGEEQFKNYIMILYDKIFILLFK